MYMCYIHVSSEFISLTYRLIRIRTYVSTLAIRTFRTAALFSNFFPTVDSTSTLLVNYTITDGAGIQ